ncbi:MAG: M23 family metallopeptidase [Anaerolineaceae bacterium]|nr:M23 family metallopeptidase [Anaerolineaceae bacterium]
MTLSMSQGIKIDPTSMMGNYQNNGIQNSEVDFNSILNMLLSSSMNSFGSNDGSSNLQQMLLTLAPLLQNMNLNTSNNYSEPPSGMPVQASLTQNYHSAHQALDFGVEVGTNVKSTMSGVVKYAGWNSEGYGNLVIVDNGTYKTYYGHLDSIPVSVGDRVSNGQVIGLSGNTGNSTGPHLHYEIRANDELINPTNYTYGKISEYFT